MVFTGGVRNPTTGLSSAEHYDTPAQDLGRYSLASVSSPVQITASRMALSTGSSTTSKSSMLPQILTISDVSML